MPDQRVTAEKIDEIEAKRRSSAAASWDDVDLLLQGLHEQQQEVDRLQSVEFIHRGCDQLRHNGNAHLISERDSLRTQNRRLRSTLEWTAKSLRTALAGKPLRCADENLVAAQMALASTIGADQAAEFRVWWIPQVPMEPFVVDVPDLATGRVLCDVLGRYDLFQLEHRVKPDYSNAGGMSWRHSVLTEGEWWDFDPDDADDLAEIGEALRGLE